MRIGSIYYGTKPVIAIYAGTKLIYSRNKVNMRSLPAFVTNDLEALLNLADALAMEVDNDTTELGLDIEAEPVTSPSMAMSAFELTEIKMDAYAEMYVKDTSPFVIVEEREVEVEADVNVQTAAAMSQETNLEVETVVDGVASDAAPIEQTIISSVEAEADMNVPIANPMAFDSVIFESDAEADAIASPASPIEGLIESTIEIEAELTIADASQLEVSLDGDTIVDVMADLFVKNIEWENPVLTNGRLYIPMSHSVTQTGGRIKIE